MNKVLKSILKHTALAVAVLGIIYLSPSAANAAGSDAPTPYSVTAQGVQLPAGTTFEANGHVNYKTTLRSGGVHFDPNNNQPGGAFIGQSFFPISLAPGECITWVQVSLYNEHFGEGNQAPVCAPPAEPPVEEEPPVVVEPPVFTPYEVCAFWLINAPAPENWPGQTILSRDCGFVSPTECVEYRIQFDKYWIRDAADEAYWLGLTVINSPADDAPLEPHDYVVSTVPAKDCTVVVPPTEEVPPTPEVPPVITPEPTPTPEVVVPTPEVATPEPEQEQAAARISTTELAETGSTSATTVPAALVWTAGLFGLGALALITATIIRRKQEQNAD